MTKDEMTNVARLIDEGILRAQERLLERARHDGSSLIFGADGEVLEVSANSIS